MGEEKIVSFDDVLEGREIIDDLDSLPSNPLDIIDSDLPEELQTVEARKVLKKIDEGIEEAERGVRTYFHTSPKRAVEFQQNHIAYLELKAKILKLIYDGKAHSQQLQQQNNIIIDDKAASELKEALIKRLYHPKDV